MATASSIHSAEELNFLRLVDLTIRIGPQAVRQEFDLQFPPSGLGTWLATNRSKVQKLKDRKKIFDAQWDLLYPTGGNPVSSQEFDITLMVCLLRNFSKFQINDHDNPTTYAHDTSKDADISRIKYYRNQIVHSKSGEMRQQEFTDIWSYVSGAIVSLAGHLRPQVQNLATAPIDADTLRFIKQTEQNLDCALQRISETESKLEILSTEKSNADELRQTVIEEWKKEDIKYKETSATKFVLETLSTKRGVIVTGPPGCGKSAVAHHVALILERQDYELHPISHPSEIMKVFCKDKKQVFVIDDICGKFVFEQTLSDGWEKEETCIEKLLKEESSLKFPQAHSYHDFNLNLKNLHCKENVNKTQGSKLKMIATCRENIYLSKSFPDFPCFDLQLCSFTTKFKLSGEELGQIALSYLDQTTLDKIENLTLFNFFPLLCSWFSHIKNPRLFTHPVEVIDAEIKGLRKNSYPSFIALALLVLYDNDLRKEKLKSTETDEMIEEICKECEIEQANRIRPEYVTFKRLIGVFISESDHGYTAVHDKMFDIIAISVSSLIMGVIIKYASSSFVRNRLQFQSFGENTLANVIYVHVEQEDLYLNRQKSEIEKRNYWVVFENLNTRYEQYRKRFIEYIEHHFTSKDFQQNSESITPLHVVASLGYIEFVNYFVKTNSFHMNISDNAGKTPMATACEKGHLSIVQYLYTYVKQFPKMMKTTNEGWSPLHLAAYYGNIDVLQFLIKIKLDINLTTNYNYTPLYLASAKGHYDTVRHLLDMNGELIDSQVDTRIKNDNGWTALHSACFKGHTNVVELLIKVGMNVNQTTKYNSTPLYLASQEGHYDTVKHLLDMNGDTLDSQVDTRIKDEDGCTALHTACDNGHTKVVELLINVGMDVNQTTKYNYTPLDLASGDGHYDTVKHLLDMNGDTLDSQVDTRIKDEDGWTALHTACYYGHTKVVELLTNVGMNVNQTTDKNSIPLILASQKGHYETVKHLLDMNGDTLDSQVDTRIKDEDGWTALHTACSNGHTKVVELLINVGMDVNQTTDKNSTPLFLASQNGHYETVKHLLDMNGDTLDSQVDTRIKDEDGWTALHTACYYGHTKVVELLINVGMDVNQTTKYNSTPFYLASQKGHYDTVKHLLDMNGDTLDSQVDTRIKNKNGWTALHTACSNGHTKVVELLTNVGMNVNQTTDKNSIPLILASQKGHYETVKHLLDMNGDTLDSQVDTRIKDEDGWTALHTACSNGHTKVVELLINVGMDVNQTTDKNSTPLFLASQNGHYETVKHLLDMNGDTLDSQVDTRIKDEDGWTALHTACYYAHTKVVELLINVGMDVNQTTKYNSTPFYLASQKGHYDTVKHLLDMNGDTLDSQVDTRIKNKNGWTALHTACSNGHTKVVELLTNVGMNVNQTTDKNSTPFYLASQKGHYDTVKHLLDMNGDTLDSQVDTRIKNKNGRTALHTACSNGHTKVVELLINVGMNVNQTTKYNSTPFYLASQKGHYDTVKHLLDMNGDTLDSQVDTRIKNEDGWTALHTACFNGHTKVVELLTNVGMNVNQTTDKNSTPLFLASQNGHYETVKHLLDMNGDTLDSQVDTRIKDEDGWTALHTACFNGYTNVVELLINIGLNINDKALDNRSPIVLAIESDHHDVVKLLQDMGAETGNSETHANTNRKDDASIGDDLRSNDLNVKDSTNKEEDTNIEKDTNKEEDTSIEVDTSMGDSMNIEEDINIEVDTSMEDSTNIEEDISIGVNTSMEDSTNIEEDINIEVDTSMEDSTNIEEDISIGVNTSMEDSTNIEEDINIEEDTQIGEDTSMEVHTSMEDNTNIEDTNIETDTSMAASTNKEEETNTKASTNKEEDKYWKDDTKGWFSSFTDFLW